jgi:uncharacterized OsmC-like protein
VDFAVEVAAEGVKAPSGPGSSSFAGPKLANSPRVALRSGDEIPADQMSNKTAIRVFAVVFESARLRGTWLAGDSRGSSQEVAMLSDEQTHRATVKLAHDYQFVATFDDLPHAKSITFDEPTPLGGNRGPNAAAVLGAAIGNCLAASLAFCLRRARADVTRLQARVTTHVARNDKGRHRISAIDVVLEPEFTSGMGPLERCGELFEDFCTVTASVRHGIPVHVSLKDARQRSAA